jgi:hypothetical protein
LFPHSIHSLDISSQLNMLSLNSSIPPHSNIVADRKTIENGPSSLSTPPPFFSFSFSFLLLSSFPFPPPSSSFHSGGL